MQISPTTPPAKLTILEDPKKRSYIPKPRVLKTSHIAAPAVLSAKIPLMSDDPKLPDGVKLVKGDTFCPEGQWFFTLDDRPLPLVWGKTEGWKVYYAANPADSRFQTKAEALKAWTEAHKCEFVPAENSRKELREELRKKLRS